MSAPPLNLGVSKHAAWALLAATLATVALAACATSKSQTLLVTDYGYSLDGVKATDLNTFEKKLRLDGPVSVEACSCANAKLVMAAVAWLHTQGVKKVSMTTIDGTEVKCGVCK